MASEPFATLSKSVADLAADYPLGNSSQGGLPERRRETLWRIHRSFNTGGQLTPFFNLDCLRKLRIPIISTVGQFVTQSTALPLSYPRIYKNVMCLDQFKVNLLVGQSINQHIRIN